MRICRFVFLFYFAQNYSHFTVTLHLYNLNIKGIG